MEDLEQLGSLNPMDDPDRLVEPAEAMGPEELAEADGPAESAEATEPPAAPQSQPRPKLPTAVTVVALLAAITALVYLSIGGLTAWLLWQCAPLDAKLQPMMCGQPPTLIDPREYVINTAHAIGVAIAMAIILAGFIRLRSWAWVALMTWCGFVLGRDLLRYYLYTTERPTLYLGLFLSALIVLALNQEDVQMTFGIKREAHDLLPIHAAENPAQRL